MSDLSFLTAANTARNIESAVKRIGRINAAATDMWDGLAVNAAVLLFRKTGDEELKNVLIAKADEFVGEDVVEVKDIAQTEYTSAPCILYEAYRITGADKYKEKAVSLEEADTYMGLAFDMMHETMFGGKEHYHAITVKFAELADKERKTDVEKAMFMEALIDTIAAIDQPVYELYRSLVDIFRRELRTLAAKDTYTGGERETECTLLGDAKAELVLAYAVKKACDMKVVLAEKYEYIADCIYNRYQETDCAYTINYAQRI